MSDIKLSPKSADVTSLLEQLTGKPRDGMQCATCESTKVNSEDFRDNLSRREFSISMMCQACQDSVFGDDE